MSPALRRHGGLLVLTVLVAAAGAVYWVDRDAPTTTEQNERKHDLCPIFRRDEVTELVVTTGGKTARIARGALTDAGQRPWQIATGGVSEPAEEAAVDQLLGSLRDGVVVRRIDHVEASERKEYGLDQPRGEIAVTMGSQRVHLVFGKTATTPAGAVFVEVEGHGVAVITAQLAAALLVSPDALRRKELVTWEANDLDALALDGAGGPRHLVRAPWRVPRGLAFRFDGSTAEGRVRVSAAALDAVWDALGRLKADAFLDANEAEIAMGGAPKAPAQPEHALARAVTITLSPHGSGRVVIELGGPCPGHPDDVVALRRRDGSPPLGACVPRGPLDALSVPAADLVDRHPIGARADEVIEVRRARGGDVLNLARSGVEWHEQTPIDRPVEAEVGRAFLDRLLAVAAVRVAEGGDPKALGLDPPRATLRVVSLLGDSREERVEEVEIGSKEGGKDGGAAVIHARRLEDGAYLELPAEAEAAVVADELALRSRKVLDLGPSEFKGLRVTGPFGVQRIERKEGGPWTLVEPRGDGLAPDPGLVSELVEAFGKLSAERWVGPARPEHALDRPRLTIAADVGSGKDARTIEIALGAPVGAGSAFARVSGDPTVFVAPPGLEAAASRWLIDRTALLVDVERLTRAELHAGDKKVVLEQKSGALTVAGAPAGDPTAAAKAASVRDALRELVADAVVSVGPPLEAQGFAKPALRATLQVGARAVQLTFGAEDTLRGARVYDARRDGIAATFAVAQERVKPLLDAFR